MIIMANFFGNGTIIGKRRISRLGLGQTERVVRDVRRVHRKTNSLVRVGVGRSDGGHEPDPSCQAVTKVPSVCRITAVLVMDMDKCVKETQNHNAILKALQEHPGDQVVYQASSLRHKRGCGVNSLGSARPVAKDTEEANK